MRAIFTTAALAAMVIGTMPAEARHHYNDDRRYSGYDRRDHDCKNNGAVGTVAGAVGGGLIGNALGGGTLGTVAGAGGGALLGRSLDKKHTRDRQRRNGC